MKSEKIEYSTIDKFTYYLATFNFTNEGRWINSISVIFSTAFLNITVTSENFEHKSTFNYKEYVHTLSFLYFIF